MTDKINEANLKITAMSLAIDSKAEGKDALSLAMELFDWITEDLTFEEEKGGVSHLKPVN